MQIISSSSIHGLGRSIIQPLILARGVAILIDKRLLLTVSKIIKDKNGSFLIIAGNLFHTPVLLVNIYAPNVGNPIL